MVTGIGWRGMRSDTNPNQNINSAMSAIKEHTLRISLTGSVAVALKRT